MTTSDSATVTPPDLSLTQRLRTIAPQKVKMVFEEPEADANLPRILRTNAIRKIEEAALSRGEPLMELAGLAAANAARGMLKDAAHHPARVLVLAGPGNNGGDAFEVAARLRDWGYMVAVCFAGDPSRFPADAARAYSKWRNPGSAVLPAPPTLEDYDLVIDGLFGIGLSRPLRAPYADWIATVNDARNTPVLSLDVPSGLDADTGRVMGCAVRATRTITFIADKPGLHTLYGPDYAGTIELAALEQRFEAPGMGASGSLIGLHDFRACLRARSANSHKGNFGTLGIVGGATGMTGAALLAGRAALYLGAGKVFLGLLDPDAPSFDPVHPELMLRPEKSVLEMPLSAAVIGPGLGTTDVAHKALTRALALPCPLVLDADALNLIAANQDLQDRVVKRGAATLMTPHPLEAARLLGTNTPHIQEDRVASAAKLADLYKAIIVLKGAGSVVASPHGRWWINASGNPGMASGGMGDVLSGIAGALLAQGFPSLATLQCAVHLHGQAADALVAEGNGPAGLTAGETIAAARRLYNRWVVEQSKADAASHS